MKKLVVVGICGTLLGGCVSGMTNSYLSPQVPQRVLIPQEVVDMMGPPQILQVGMGQTVEGRANHFYEFKGKPGDQVTLVVRSKGTDASLYLYGDANDYRRNMEPMAFVGSIGGISGVVDPDGPNAHLLVTLPADPDGSYVAVVGPQDQADYSLTVLPGLVPQRELMALPTPIYGNEGQFMSPFTEDNTVTAWVEKGLQAEVASNVGTALGSLAAMSNSDNIMLSVFGGAVGSIAGREVMLRAIGGWDFIKDNSDLSFNSLEEMAKYMAYENSSHPQYAQVLNATYGIYPELRPVMQKVQMEKDSLTRLYPNSFITVAQQ